MITHNYKNFEKNQNTENTKKYVLCQISQISREINPTLKGHFHHKLNPNGPYGSIKDWTVCQVNIFGNFRWYENCFIISLILNQIRQKIIIYFGKCPKKMMTAAFVGHKINLRIWTTVKCQTSHAWPWTLIL